MLIPLGELPQRYAELDRSRLVVCSADRASAAPRRPHSCAGASRGSLNLTGGILAWIDEVDPSQPKY